MAGLTFAGLAVPMSAAPAAAACSDVAATESAAAELATSCGRPVIVDALRDEYSQVIAQPDGRMTFQSSVLPERVRRGAGWADINLDLSPGSDGLLRPAASVADVAFSNGGTAPLVTLTRGGRTMTMSWPGTLRPPTVEDNAATYSEVLFGVDLVVRATETGFTHVLVIKSAAAATQSAVREIRFDLGGDAEIQAVDGELRAMNGTSLLASTAPAKMWDSRTTGAMAKQSARSTSVQQAAPASPSTDEAAGDAARVAPVSVVLSGGDLLLRPDEALLKEAAFPLYVDPTWSIAKAKWAYSTDNGSTNTDYSTARVGLNPDTGALYRSFFQFNTTLSQWTLIGKYIKSARVAMKLDHSSSCEFTPASMYQTSVIDATMKATWSKMYLLKYLASASGRSNEAGGCGVIQGDQMMNFQGTAVTKLVQDAATAGWSGVTVGFTANDSAGNGETWQTRWKKFLPNNAIMYADYDSKPTKPTSLQVATMTCGTETSAITIGTFTPTFSAVFNDPDGSQDTLTGAFEWIEVPSGGIGKVTSAWPRLTAPPNKYGVDPGDRATSTTVTTVKGKRYAFRAKATDTYSQTSDWSAWCQFSVDTTVPHVSGRVLTATPMLGQTVKIRLESTSSDVKTFKYGWDGRTKPINASTTTSTAIPKVADIEVTAPRLGTNILLIQAIDGTLNQGDGAVEFAVEVSPNTLPPAARWALETNPGLSEQQALEDSVLAPADPLNATNVTWQDGIRLTEARTATFDGVSSAATTEAAVVNTAESFSVAAWVRLGTAVPSTNVTVAAQGGDDAAGFELGVRRSGTTPASYWSFAMKDTSAQSSTVVAALAPTALTASDVGRWVHLAGSFDKAEKAIRLFIDGTEVSEVSRTAIPWPATKSFTVGRGFTGNAASGFWNGSISDVQAFNRVLLLEDFHGRLASDSETAGFSHPGIVSPVQVGGWDFETAMRCKHSDRAGTCQAPDRTTAWGRWLALTRGADIRVGPDLRWNGLWLDDEYSFPSDNNVAPESETTSEYARSAVKLGTDIDDDGIEITQWDDRQVLRTDQSYSISVWAAPAAGKTGTHSVIAQRGINESAFSLQYNADTSKWVFAVGSQDTPNAAPSTVTSLELSSDTATTQWTHLTVVYDAGAKQARIYINGTRAGDKAVPTAPFNATGPLLVGQTWHHGAMTNQWHGGIDDIAVYQGALTDAAAHLLHMQQLRRASTAEPTVTS
ncbi:LamG domain-containing protein [Actinoplanes utahensis]|uniref:LamG domain-containing protein n=1 Tax=Actinoplanes utahensis TaxID=1869 RepID=UPI001F393341|nr:LamG domain-containing protein [Actinoplanes utahensis]